MATVERPPNLPPPTPRRRRRSSASETAGAAPPGRRRRPDLPSPARQWIPSRGASVDRRGPGCSSSCSRRSSPSTSPGGGSLAWPASCSTTGGSLGSQVALVGRAILGTLRAVGRATGRMLRVLQHEAAVVLWMLRLGRGRAATHRPRTLCSECRQCRDAPGGRRVRAGLTRSLVLLSPIGDVIVRVVRTIATGLRLAGARIAVIVRAAAAPIAAFLRATWRLTVAVGIRMAVMARARASGRRRDPSRLAIGSRGRSTNRRDRASRGPGDRRDAQGDMAWGASARCTDRGRRARLDTPWPTFFASHGRPSVPSDRGSWSCCVPLPAASRDRLACSLPGSCASSTGCAVASTRSGGLAAGWRCSDTLPSWA